ncbi:hypothetical protein, partial [Paraburkholderia tropica]|uniref:hypothetical protein n=1 Tax=Paraburkholderia tropica TaxID=92647 RepID=UPI000AF00FE7
RRERKRAVFDEAVGVEQIVEIFARGALAGLAPLRDRVRTAFRVWAWEIAACRLVTNVLG